MLSVLGAACSEPTLHAADGDEIAEAYIGQSRLREIFIARDGHLVSPVLAVPHLASRVGTWVSMAPDHADDAFPIEVRGFTENGAATPWIAIEETWSDPVLGRLQRVGRANFDTLVVAAELRIQIEHADRLAGLVWSAVIPSSEHASIHTDASPSARQTARDVSDAGVRVTHVDDGTVDGRSANRQLALDFAGVTARSAWNARPDAGCISDASKTWVTVHHSVSPLNLDASADIHAATLRGTQAYHMDTRGFCDIGYHFAVTADGTVWEGRAANQLGAHTGNHNENNVGIAFIGCFHPTSDCNGLGATTPPQRMVESGAEILGTIARHYRIALDADHVMGHRDSPDQSTLCPGDSLSTQIPTLRALAMDNGSEATAPSGRVLGAVWNLAVTEDVGESAARGARLPGAVVRVDDGPSTTATAPDGLWSFDLAPGTYTITAISDGFTSASRTVQVTSGSDTWASIGLSPAPDAVDLTVRVVDRVTNAPIAQALVTVTGAAPSRSDADGKVQFSVLAGRVDVEVSATGYSTRTLVEVVAAGRPAELNVSLEPDPNAGASGTDGDLSGGPDENTDAADDALASSDQIQRVTILPPEKTSGGCASTGRGPGDGAVWALALMAALHTLRPATRQRRR